MLTTCQRLCPRPSEITTRSINGKVIIIDLTTSRSYATDNVGRLIWEMIQRRHNVEETVSATVERYDVGLEQAQRDVVHFVAELCRQNLISVSEDGTADRAKSMISQTHKLPYQTPILDIQPETSAADSVSEIQRAKV